MVNRPALRYHGGKWRLAPWIIRHFPEHVCYVEPFAGGASVLLRKSHSMVEVLNDLDGEVVNFFRMLRDRTEDLERAVALTPYARAELEVTYSGPPTDDPVERARRFFVRSWQSRGGGRQQWKTGWRFQRNGNERTPYTKDWDDTSRLYALAARLKQVAIEEDDALAVIARFDAPTTLFYCDPPYVRSTRGLRWSEMAYQHEMTDEQHEELARALNEVQGMVILSGYRCELYERLYADWLQVERRAVVDGRAERLGPAPVECLWLSPRAAAAARQQPLVLAATGGC